MMRIGFFLTPTKGWLGGINYFKNLFLAVGAVADSQVELFVVVPANVDEEALRMMLPPEPSNVKVVRARLLQNGHPCWFAWRGIRKLFGVEVGARPLVKKLRLNAVSHSDFFRGTGVPVLNWLPDFQHVHLPQMFDVGELESRTLKYANLARHASRIVVSSEDARRDFDATLPDVASKARVLRFVSPPPPTYWALNDTDFPRVRDLYQLDHDYFYVPNQFWRHKNHGILLDAIKILKERNLQIQIVCSGAAVDHRDPAHYERLRGRAEEIGCESSFKTLGVIPYADVFSLIRFSRAVINPSKFEGWSSTVEECKSTGKKMLLSDIPVHREQLPEASFFNPDNAVELADLLQTEISAPAATHPDAVEQAAINRKRLIEYGSRYMAIVNETISGVRT